MGLAALTVCWCVIPKGEGCVALRAAEISYTEFQITLTHHGEKTGTLTGGIQLRTSEGKPTEKLYGEAELHSGRIWSIFFLLWLLKLYSYFGVFSDFIKIERDDPIASKGKSGDLNK